MIFREEESFQIFALKDISSFNLHNNQLSAIIVFKDFKEKLIKFPDSNFGL